MKKIQDAGYQIVEAPVHHFHRAYGKSQFFNVPRIVRTLFDIVKLWRALVWRKTPDETVARSTTTDAESLPPRKRTEERV